MTAPAATMRRMKRILPLLLSLSLVAAHAADAPPPSGTTDLVLDVVKLDPPPGSTLEEGDVIHATIQWRYRRPAGPVRIFAKLDRSPDDVLYEADHLEAHAGGAGRVERFTGLNKPGHVDSVLLVAKDAATSREIYRRVVKADYTFVAAAGQEALRQEGAGSRITSISFDPPSPARLAPGDRVRVRIGYDAQARHGVRPSAEPVTDCPMTFTGVPDGLLGQGVYDQAFTVGVPCIVRQVRVQLLNAGGVAVAEKVVDVDLRYGR